MNTYLLYYTIPDGNDVTEVHIRAVRAEDAEAAEDRFRRWMGYTGPHIPILKVERCA